MTYLVGLVVLVVSLIHHDAGIWSPILTWVLVGAIVAWLGLLVLLVGLAAYGVRIAGGQSSTAEPVAS